MELYDNLAVKSVTSVCFFGYNCGVTGITAKTTGAGVEKDILIDCGHIRNAYSGLGQVALQYARALIHASQSRNTSRQSDTFRPLFLSHPRFATFHQFVRGHNGHVCIPKFSLLGAIMRIQNKEWTRYAYRQQGHVLRHALHRNFYRIPDYDNKPFVLTIHDMHLLHDKPKRQKHAVLRLQKSIQRAQAIGFISQYARRVASEHVDFGDVPQHIIYNGVNKPENPRRPPWFDDNMRPFLFSVAQIAPSKNYHILPAMLNHIPDIHLIVAGRKKKYYAPQIQEAARREKVADRLLMPGAVDEGEKAWLLEHCDGFVFPSLREGFGMPVVEALHFGKPVFCFANTALPEAGGECAFYWQNQEPKEMADLIRDNVSFNESASAARQQWAAQFSWDKNAEAYLDIYRQLAS